MTDRKTIKDCFEHLGTAVLRGDTLARQMAEYKGQGSFDHRFWETCAKKLELLEVLVDTGNQMRIMLQGLADARTIGSDFLLSESGMAEFVEIARLNLKQWQEALKP